MQAAKALPSIFKAAKIIYDISKIVKANKQQCQRLSERIQCIVTGLEDDSVNNFNTTAMEKALQNLSTTLNESIQFVEEFTGDSAFRRLLKNSDYHLKFEELNMQLSHNATDLNLALNITSIFDPHQDVLDRQADLVEISSKLDDIARELVNQQQQLLNHNKDMKGELNRRFDSFKFHLKQNLLKVQNPVEAKKIEEESKLFLHIPAHDLVSEEQIGAGGFADVYKGMWLSQHHRVAIKTIRITYLTENIKENFLHEIAAMYRIRYDHVLGVFGACIEPNYYALVVEYMSLGSLFDVLKKKEHVLSWSDRWSIALQMTKGVNYLHMMSILHRDIKSLNFLMDHTVNGYLIKISDFGLAKIRQETSRQTVERTEQQAVAGTLQWKAPELLKFGKPTKASDIYSLGVVYWELATRCIPYDEADEAVVSQGVKSGERLDIPNDVPSSFALIISKAWRQEPNNRPTSQELIQEIMPNLPATVEKTVIPKFSLTTAPLNDSRSTILSNDSNKSTATPVTDVVTRELNISSNPKLELVIAEFEPYSKINLNKQQLTDSDMKIVVEHAITNKRCRNLWLEYNKITSKGASILADALCQNSTLYELWLYNNDISDAGVCCLAKALLVNKTLKKLGLASNNITNTGVSHLVKMLEKNSTLSMLGLAMNKIDDQGVKMLANTLTHENTTLQILTLDRNQSVTDLCIDSLIDIVKKSRSMKELWVNDCSMSDRGKKKLQETAASRKDFKLMTTCEKSS